MTPDPNTVSNHVAPDSDSYTFNSAGTFYWQATYSGDGNDARPGLQRVPSGRAGGQPEQSVGVDDAVGSRPDQHRYLVHDSATISGATSGAGGTITYKIYSDNTCATEVADVTPDPNTVSNHVAPDSDSYTFNSAGTFYWQATYSGDGNNTGPVSRRRKSETLVVNLNSPSVSTTLSDLGPISIGTSVHDSATISGATSMLVGRSRTRSTPTTPAPLRWRT